MPNQDSGNLVTIKINKKNIYNNKNNISQSVINKKENKKEKTTDGLTDNYANFFKKIFNNCELESFEPEVREMFETAIERLYYSEELKVGSALLPQAKIHGYLMLLDHDALNSVLERIKQYSGNIVNQTGYLMSSIINEVCERSGRPIFSQPPDICARKNRNSYYGGSNWSWNQSSSQSGAYDKSKITFMDEE